MELASYLAGERWSDHPTCTHPLLAAMARAVNDHVGDGARQRLAPMIPDVIGLTSTDPRLDARIALEAALTALPVVSGERQGVAAVGVLRCEQVLDALEGRPSDYLSPRAQATLEQVPHALRWARSFPVTPTGSLTAFRRRSAPTIVHSAVVGLSRACIEDPENALVDLLATVIAQMPAWCATGPAAEVTDNAWRSMCELTSRR